MAEESRLCKDNGMKTYAIRSAILSLVMNAAFLWILSQQLRWML